MLAFRCIQKLPLVVIIMGFFYTVNAHTVKMDYLPFTFMPEVLICGSKMKQSWVCTHIITFNVGFKTQAVIYYSGSFRLFSEALHYSAVPLLAAWFWEPFSSEEGLWFSAVYFFLIVDSKWHLWDTLIKQFFLLLRPARYFQQIFSFICVHFFFFWETLAAFCDPQSRSRLRQKEVSLTWAPWQPLGRFVRALSPTLNQIYC